jgi:hypothetical protein
MPSMRGLFGASAVVWSWFAPGATVAVAQSSPANARAPAATTPAQPHGAPEWLVADPAAKTVTIALRVTREGDGPRINGHRNGDLRIVVPLGQTVQWDWRNADSTSPHSLVVMVQREKLPTEGGRAAFSNAMSRMVTAGLAAGQDDRTTFTADEAGWYWLLCGVPGHAIAGEYLELRVDPEATTAGVKVK